MPSFSKKKEKEKRYVMPMCSVPALNREKEKKKERMWSDFETHVRPPTTRSHKISHTPSPWPASEGDAFIFF